MPDAAVNGITLHYEEFGSGEPVLLIMGSGARGGVWRLYQVPALLAAGYRAITVDNRGIAPSSVCVEGFTIEDMVADTAGLIEHLGIAPCRVVGFSLGGMVVQELLLARPELVSQAVLIASRGRSDAMRDAITAAEAEMVESGVRLPPRQAAVTQALQFLSPATLNDEVRARDWLETFEMSPADPASQRAQKCLDLQENRLEEYRKITAQCLVLGFRDDLIIPPHLSRELAAHIPAARYAEFADCGHYGCFEAPDAVNAAIVGFFRDGR